MRENHFWNLNAFLSGLLALSLERERELQELQKTDDAKLPQSFKNNYFKPNGVRNNYLGGQQLSPSQRAAPPLTPSKPLQIEIQCWIQPVDDWGQFII